MATSAFPIARMIGEGVGRPNAEQELPIDINYQKLVDWLVSYTLFYTLKLHGT